MKVILICLLVSFSAQSQEQISSEIFKKWTNTRSVWADELRLAQDVSELSRNDDKLRRALKGQTQGKSFLTSIDFTRLDPVRKIEWLIRVADPTQIEVSQQDMKAIGTLALAERVLGILLENRLTQVFQGKLEIKVFREKMRLGLEALPKEILFNLKKGAWWDWFLQDDSRALGRDFQGFSPEIDPRLEGLVFFSRAIKENNFLQRWNNFSWARYVLNSDPQTRARGLIVFDEALQKIWLSRDLAELSRARVESFLNVDEPGLMDHRFYFLRQWEILAAKLEIKSTEEILLETRISWSEKRGTPVSIGEWFRLAQLRVDLEKVDEAFRALAILENRILDSNETNSGGLVSVSEESWNLSQKIDLEILKARAVLNLSKLQKEPTRGETLAWAQEYFRRSLEMGALLSDRRDEVLMAYSQLLESRGFWVEASEAWHSLFLGGRDADSRKQGLFKAAQVLAWNLKKETPQEATQKILFRFASLSSFFVRAYPYTKEGRTLAATLRVESRKKGFSKDPVIGATLFEIESLSDPKFLSKQKNTSSE